MGAASVTADYVIVGAGSAGCVLAHRLSAGDASVLLIEAGGPDDGLEMQIPAAFPELFGTAHDWEYTTAPQPALDDRELYWPRGKCLGGSNSMNALIHVRGHPRDYDQWAARGNDGWSWEAVLPAFRRLEADDYGDPAYHGRDGPMYVHRPEPPELTAAWIEAAEAAGISPNDDFNGEHLAGVGPFPVNVTDGRRHSTADGYLEPALGRETLTVETDARATRILFDADRAVGVEYERDGERVQVRADAEVIVSAGAINSPQLLLLSGIGPATHLRAHGITVVCDLPGVGRNLTDHLQVPVIYGCSRPVTVDDARGLRAISKYLLLKRGPLTSNVAEAGAFLHVTDEEAPDLQVHFGRAYFERHGFENDEDGHAFTMLATLLTPESTGRITLRSADPLADPVIDPQYCTASADVDRLVAGLARCRDIARQPPLDEYRDTLLVPDEWPETTAGLVEHVRTSAQTLYHPVGTCAMGPARDELSVVDDDLRVHGVSNLRVVDASVMPTIPRGNTNTPTIMVAERAAEMIRTDPKGEYQ